MRPASVFFWNNVKDVALFGEWWNSKSARNVGGNYIFRPAHVLAPAIPKRDSHKEF